MGPLSRQHADRRRPGACARLPRRATTALVALVVVLVAAGCGREEPDLVNGKALFVQNCGNCHTLERAGTQGAQGPNLDEAFGPARADGLGEQTIQGVVREQIDNVLRGSMMPEDLVQGEDAQDVAAYVAEVAGMPGEDTGALASAGLAGAETGEQIFTAGGCGGCHTFAPTGTTSDVGPNLDELAAAADQRVPGQSAEEYTETAIVAPDEFVVQGFNPGVMPALYGEQLEEEQVQALVDYLLNPEAAGG